MVRVLMSLSLYLSRSPFQVSKIAMSVILSIGTVCPETHEKVICFPIQLPFVGVLKNNTFQCDIYLNLVESLQH